MTVKKDGDKRRLHCPEEIHKYTVRCVHPVLCSAFQMNQVVRVATIDTGRVFPALASALKGGY